KAQSRVPPASLYNLRRIEDAVRARSFRVKLEPRQTADDRLQPGTAGRTSTFSGPQAHLRLPSPPQPSACHQNWRNPAPASVLAGFLRLSPAQPPLLTTCIP